MTKTFADAPSRRRFLAGALGTAAIAATAGCLDSVLSSSGATPIEPEEPTEPREGTPEEFYYFLEANGIEVDELTRDGDDLLLTYRSEATDVDDSDAEIVVIYEVYKQALVLRGSEVEFLYTEISNPFDGQALGWGIDSDWVHQYDSEEAEDETDDGGDSDDLEEGDVEDSPPGESEGDTGEETHDGDEAEDMNQIMLWNSIMNTKVYEEDL